MGYTRAVAYQKPVIVVFLLCGQEHKYANSEHLQGITADTKMPLYHQPVRLEELSLRSIGKYVADLGVQLVTSTQPPKSADQGSARSISQFQAKQVCDELQQVLHSMIPYSMANIVTLEFLKLLDDRYSYIRGRINEPLCKKVLKKFVKAILHPKLTELDIKWEWNYILIIVLSQLDIVSCLKVFRLTVWDERKYRRNGGRESLKEALVKCLKKMKNLEEFVLPRYSSDELIDVISKSSTCLKYLDVSGSSRVSDTSIDVILGFKHLEGLDVSKTGISIIGQNCLMMNLSLNQLSSVKEFGFSFLNSSQIRTMVAAFPFLRKLNIRVNNFVRLYWNDTLKLLNNLEELKITGCKSISMPNLETLLELELDVYDIDVHMLSNNCPSLQKLTLKTVVLKCTEPASVFTSLHCLSVWTINFNSLKYILSLCSNLMTLQLCTHQTFYESFLAELLEMNPLSYLEVIFLGTLTGNIPPETVALLTKHCSNLTTCKVFGRNYGDLKTMYKDYPGVQIDRDGWIIQV